MNNFFFGTRLIRLACGILFVLQVAACGGGGGGGNTAATSQQPTQSATGAAGSGGSVTTSSPESQTSGATPPSTSGSTTDTPPQATVKIEFYGDSTIRGYLPFTGETPPVTTPQAFEAALPGIPDYVVANEGVNSSKVSQLLAGTDGVHPAWEDQMARSTAKIIITNHCSQYGSDVATYLNDMRTLVQVARKYGKTIIFMTPNQTAGGAGFLPYVAAMKDAARLENVPVIDVYQYLENYMASTGKRVSDIVPDGYHPTAEVYVLIGQYAAAEFTRLMQ